MKIYVASKWQNKDRVREIMFELVQAGNSITVDWTTHNKMNADYALEDVRGVQECDAFVGIFEDEVPYKGALVEFGIALALGKPIYILGNSSSVSNNLFMLHPNVHKGIDLYRQDLIEKREYGYNEKL